MTLLKLAHTTIAGALETGQIGTPVAARLVLHASADHGTIEPQLARALEAVSGWLGGDVETIFAFGGVDQGQISALLRFAGGASALVSAGVCGVGSPRCEALVWGSRGVLSWEPDQEPTGGFDEAARPTEAAGRLLARVRRALVAPASGRAPQPAGWSQPPVQPRRPPYGLLLVAGEHTHQPGYAEALAADPRCRLIGLTDESSLPDRRRRLNEQLARRLDIPLLADLDQALARRDVHLVSVCAEPARRGRIIVKAAGAGKHVYLDKPLCGSLEDADRIVAAVGRAGVVGHMFSQVHFDPAQRIRDILASGRLGELIAIHHDLYFAKGQAGTARLGAPRAETAAPQRYELLASKRELSNVGVYSLVMFLWLLQRRVQRVCAATGNFFFSEHQDNDMEDFGQILMELDGGVIASLTAARAGWRSHRSGGLNRTYLVGSQAVAVIDAHRPRVEVWADVPPWTAPDRDPADPMGMWAAPPDHPFRAAPKLDWLTPSAASWQTDAAHFLDCVEQGRQSEVPAGLAAATTEVLLAAYKSAAAGKAVALPLPR